MDLRDYERVMKSAADPTRVRILKILEGGEVCVCQIAAILTLGQPTVSKHLSLLKAAGMVRERREKKWIWYGRDADGGSDSSRRMLATLEGWLNDDATIREDRRRESLARKLGPAAICEQGMTLTARQARACCAVRTEEGGKR